MRFFEGDAFSAANLVIARRVPLTLRSATMIENGNTYEINAELFSLAANDLFAPDERNACEALSDDERGSAHGAVIFAFRQNDVLRVGGGARVDMIENVHGWIKPPGRDQPINVPAMKKSL